MPKRVWDYLAVWVCERGDLYVSSSRYNNGQNALEIVTGETPGISEYIDFGFYNWVTYQSKSGLGEISLERWLGVSHNGVQLMSYWIITVSGKIISCDNLQCLT